MQITEEWLNEWYDTFNHEYFHIRAPKPRLLVSHSRRLLGTMTCRRAIGPGQTVRFSYTLRVSNFYDLTERQFQNVLLHEMIHYSIMLSGKRDTSPHGILFRTKMKELNERYGWEISVTTTMKKFEVRGGKQSDKTFLVMVLHLADHKVMISVVNPHYAKRINLRAHHVRSVKHIGWFTSHNSLFSTYTVVRSLRGFIFSEAEAEPILATLTPLHA